MGALEFTIELSRIIAGLIQAALWPAVILFVAWKYKTEISVNLHDLLSRMESFRAGPVEGKWGARVRRIEESISASSEAPDDQADGHREPTDSPLDPSEVTESHDPNSAETDTSQASDSNPNLDGREQAPQSDRPSSELNQKPSRNRLPLAADYATGIEFSRSIASELFEAKAIANTSPIGAVLSAYTTLERALRNLFGEHASSMDFSTLQRNLKRCGQLPGDVSGAVGNLASLRNDVVHKTYLKLRPIDALTFVDAALKCTESLVKPEIVYATRVWAELMTAFPRVVVPNVDSDRADFRVHVTEKRSFSIVLKHSRHGLLPLAFLRKVIALHPPSTTDSGVCLITNSELPDGARNMMTGVRHLRIIYWSPEDGSHALQSHLREIVGVSRKN